VSRPLVTDEDFKAVRYSIRVDISF
jgi:hypothetical protein